jgi:hypothetical protein
MRLTLRRVQQTSNVLSPVDRTVLRWEAGMADRVADKKSGTAPTPIHQFQGARVLIYSHDTFGLGHLRRSRAIANAIVERWPDASVVIISGSPVIGNFEFGSGVDYIRIPE